MSSKQYFNLVASQWDQMRQGFFSETVREKAYSVAGLAPGRIAADIGAGTGFITEGLVKRGLRVIAVDQSETMLAEMRKKLTSVEDIEYRLGESERLPIANESVDYVFANMYLHHVERPPAAVQEMVRILKPGGKLVLTDLEEHNFEFLRDEHHDRWLGFKKEEVGGWLAQAGLKNVAVENVGESCCAQSECGGQSASISIFVAFGQKDPSGLLHGGP